MSTIHGTTELGPATSKLQVYSPLETYWNAFQEWRNCQRLRATLSDLSDTELMDIGTTRGEIKYVTSNRGIDREASDPPKDPTSTYGGRVNLVARRRALRLIESLPSAAYTWRRRVSRRRSSSHRANCQRKLRK